MSAPGQGHPELRYEQTDVRPAAVVRFAIGLVVVIAVAAVALLGLFAVFAKQQRRHDPPPPPLARPTGDLPPMPRLQVTPLQDLEQVRSQAAFPAFNGRRFESRSYKLSPLGHVVLQREAPIHGDNGNHGLGIDAIQDRLSRFFGCAL